MNSSSNFPFISDLRQDHDPPLYLPPHREREKRERAQCREERVIERLREERKREGEKVCKSNNTPYREEKEKEIV